MITLLKLPLPSTISGPVGLKVGRIRSPGATPGVLNGPNRWMVIVSPGLHRVPDTNGFSAQVKSDGGITDVPASGTGTPPNDPRSRETVGALGSMMSPRAVMMVISEANKSVRPVSLADRDGQSRQLRYANPTAREETRRMPALGALLIPQLQTNA